MLRYACTVNKIRIIFSAYHMSHVSEFHGRDTNINHTGLENVLDDDFTLLVLTGSILSLGSQFLHCEQVSQQADTQQDKTSLGVHLKNQPEWLQERKINYKPYS